MTLSALAAFPRPATVCAVIYVTTLSYHLYRPCGSHVHIAWARALLC